MIATSSNALTPSDAGDPRYQKRAHPGELDLVLATVSHELRRPLAAILGWTHLNNVVRNVSDAAQPETVEGKVQLVTNLAAHPVLVRGDAKRLHQIVGNLVANAIKFTPSTGRIALSLSPVDCEAIVEVADSGVGITPSDLPKIFEPFWQADMASPFSREGLGLGLAIVRRFVQWHGGTIEAISAGSGCGTRMVIRLPLDAQNGTRATVGAR